MTREDKILIDKIEDKARLCSENSMITNSDFLDMHQRSLAAEMRLNYPDVKRVFYGVFDGANPQPSAAIQSAPLHWWQDGQGVPFHE